jgi:Glycosyl hydrolases family 43/Carbohydrate binding module (family 6)
MKKLAILILSITGHVWAQNPIILDQFTADPTARVFGDSIYLYPSHDIPVRNGKGRAGWFCMEDYHAFSSADLTDWIDHGIIVSQNKVKWVDSNAYSMWAPDCIFRNGKYYFYFPTRARDTNLGKGFSIGVAISDKPTGPFIPQDEPISGVHGIDPNVFIDKDGQAYLYWAEGNLYAAKLKENMLELASEPKVLDSLPVKGLKEGPFVFERNGLYYLTYPHVQNKTERLEYAIGDNPMGPYKVTGVIMDESPTGCWTNHHSLIEFKGQWYLFYHHNDLSPKFDKNRSVRIDSLFFEADGAIRKVIPTLRGVGLTKASRRIQIDRFSSMSDKGAGIRFLDSLNTFEGWKTVLDKAQAWVQYNAVDFGNGKFKAVSVRAASETGGTLEIRLDAVDGPVIGRVVIPKGAGWGQFRGPLKWVRTGVHNLVVMLEDNAHVEIDWVSFE